ncbi:MAG: glycosyltransferase, partial [Verrucomicrobia bacterium]|nr:glycosyltransferase [Verrucomicrobiota bacterium]
GPLAATVAPAVRQRALQPFDLHLDWFAPGLLGFVRRTRPAVVLCMGRMANCHASRLAFLTDHLRQPTRVVTTMRTGKPLPARYVAGLRRTAHVVANSADARDTLVARYAIPREKISVIHNSLVFPATAALARDDALRAQHGANPATTVLLNVAMFRPEKNQRELIELAAGLPAGTDWQLWLAGDGPARAACEALAAEKNLTARVRFLGFHRDPSPLYAAADLAVHASWSEALSNFLIEAQAHGLPAVAYDAQGITECFLPGQTGWAIARDDRAAFRAALTRLIAAPPAERAALSAAAHAHARTAFDPTRQATAYLDLFQTLLAHPTP